MKQNSHTEKDPHTIINYLNGHIQEPMNLSVLSKAMGLSPLLLSTIFAANIKIRFDRYVSLIRASYAEILLGSTDLTVTDIWLQAGFECQSTFNKAFKILYGMSPIKYRLQR